MKTWERGVFAALATVLLAVGVAAQTAAQANAPVGQGQFLAADEKEGEVLVLYRNGTLLAKVLWKGKAGFEKDGDKVFVNLSAQDLPSTRQKGIAKSLVGWQLRLGACRVIPGKAIGEVTTFEKFGLVRLRAYLPAGIEKEVGFGLDWLLVGTADGRWIPATTIQKNCKATDALRISAVSRVFADGKGPEANSPLIAVDIDFLSWPAGDPPVTWGRPGED